MKALYILPLFLMLFSCNSKSNTIQTIKDNILQYKADTTVAGNVLPQDILGKEYFQKEYFVIMKNDTSSFSVVITENKISGKMSMRYWYTPYEKIAFSYSSNDTAAVSQYEPVKRFNHKSTYEDQIRELKLILKYASKDFNMSKVSNISFALRTFDEICQNTTKQYIGKYGETFTNGSNGKIVALMENTSLIKNLNNILVPYSLTINKTSMDGLMYYVPDNSKTGTKPIIDGMIILSLVKLP